MSDALTLAEIEEQLVELLPARTVMQGLVGTQLDDLVEVDLFDDDGDGGENNATNVQGDVQQSADGDDDDLLGVDLL